MRTTPTAALDILVSLPFLDLWIIKEALAPHLRIWNGREWGRTEVKYDHIPISQIAEEKIPISYLRVNKVDGPIGFQRGYKVIIPEREQWTEVLSAGLNSVLHGRL